MGKILSKIGRKLRGWQRLSGKDRRRLMLSFVVLPLMKPGLRIFGFGNMKKVLSARSPAVTNPVRNQNLADESSIEECREITRIVNSAAYHLPFKPTCLHKSLALWWMLQREGYPSKIILGAKKEGNQFEAHAWVEYQDVILNDTEDVKERYASFDYPAVNPG